MPEKYSKFLTILSINIFVLVIALFVIELFSGDLIFKKNSSVLTYFVMQITLIKLIYILQKKLRYLIKKINMVLEDENLTQKM